MGGDMEQVEAGGSPVPSGPLGPEFVKPVLFILVGILIAFPIFSLTYYTMVRTSTPRFCATCHEIQPAYDTWKTSTHVNNAQGFVADCMDCHLPAPQDTIDFFYAKTFHGIKDIIKHFTIETYDRAKNREAAYASFKNAQCQKCHRNLLSIPNNRGAWLAHKATLYPRPGLEKRCVDCHRNLVHNPSPVFRYKQYRPPYQGTGMQY
jgi:cytochrome c-type protein NapC/trimethylamine-N-oxide reductase cytochrome c-type subunit TorC